jgi:hypothetical protein
MSEGVRSFGFDEGKDIKDNSFPKFKGEKGQTYVFGFAWDVPNEIFRMSEGHYSNSLQQGWQCLSDEAKGIKECCCTASYDGMEAKKKIGCAIVLYKFDANDNNKITGVKDVVSWTFSPKVFQSLRAICSEPSADCHERHNRESTGKDHQKTFHQSDSQQWRNLCSPLYTNRYIPGATFSDRTGNPWLYLSVSYP